MNGDPIKQQQDIYKNLEMRAFLFLKDALTYALLILVKISNQKYIYINIYIYICIIYII